MDAVKFIQERRRMYALGCIKKGINDFNTKAEDVVKEVEEWSAAHPRKTRQNEFLKQWPKATIKDGVVRISPCTIDESMYDVQKCNGAICLECRINYWNQEVE